LFKAMVAAEEFVVTRVIGAAEKISRAKAQRHKPLPRFYGVFFAPLRLCVRKMP